MFTQMGTSGNLPFIYSLLFALPAFPCFCFLWRLLYIFFHPGIPSFFLSAAVYFFSFSLITCAVSWCSWLSHPFHVVRVPGSNPGGTILTTLLLPWNASLLYVPCLYTFLLLYPFMSWVFCLECLYMSSHSVGSYQVGYTRSHPNTEVKMLRAC